MGVTVYNSGALLIERVDPREASVTVIVRLERVCTVVLMIRRRVAENLIDRYDRTIFQQDFVRSVEEIDIAFSVPRYRDAAPRGPLSLGPNGAHAHRFRSGGFKERRH